MSTAGEFEDASAAVMLALLSAAAPPTTPKSNVSNNSSLSSSTQSSAGGNVFSQTMSLKLEGVMKPSFSSGQINADGPVVNLRNTSHLSGSIIGANGHGSDSARDDASSRHHSGTQRRPKRESYRSESEYLAAYTRWRQVRDRNNDAVKRSREKYKMKKKSEVSDTPRELQLESQLDALKAQLGVMAKAYCRHPLSPNERNMVNAIVAEYAS